MLKLLKSKSRALNKIIGITFVLFIIFNFGVAKAQTNEWIINSIESNIYLNQDSSLNITEKIEADFKIPSHGITRYIPFKYNENGKVFSLPINDFKVTDSKNNSVNFTQSQNSANKILRIGDADKFITGKAEYIISYKVQRAVLFLKDHDEIYFNPVGTGWDTQINKAVSHLHLPTSLANQKVDTKCYTGIFGSSEENCKIENTKNQTITYSATNILDPNQGLTIVAGFPSNIISKPTQLQEILWFLKDNYGIAFPFITASIMFFLWQKHGKDDTADKTAIMPLYSAPDNLTPLELGTILDETADMKDITASIIDLATRGYLKITEIKIDRILFFDSTDYKLDLLKDFTNDPKLKQFEKDLLDGIFGTSKEIKLSELKNKFYKILPDLKKQIYQSLTTQNYFYSNPDKVRSKYLIGAAALTFVPLWGGGFIGLNFTISLMIGLILSSLIIAAVGSKMPKKTKKGAQTLIGIKGLEEFIKTAETDRLKFFEKENIFEKLMGYAMVFGVLEKWCEKFKDIYKGSPDWYVSGTPGIHTFNYLNFNRSLNSFSKSAEQTFQSTPQGKSSSWGGGSGLGGGGFSGGGFGGGGGGRW